ncbi:hypothetical protein ABTY98_05405 [Streptomyces sp. NPDC096040]|uniref:hypothetical protein n=1 Tax=Streptomyces sp. NPDC096040 TaxID=3155541 RepID=UPI003317240D
MTTTAAGHGQPFKVLCSYAYFRGHNFGPLLESVHQGPAMVFGDSGAHSARTLGISLTLDGYATWCHRWDQHLTLYANLDVIGAPEATWRNQQALETQHGLTPIPVFHTGEPWSYLERYIDEGYTYIALGKLLGNPLDDLLPWLDKAFRIAGDRAVFHGFGMTVWDVVRRLPFYSVDSSTWTQPYRFGIVKLFDHHRGQWVSFLMRDKQKVLQHRDLLRAHHTDPRVYASHGTYDRTEATVTAAVAWRRAEAYLRARHGPIRLPPSPRNPITRHGGTATPGLHLYLAESTTTNIYRASNGVRARAHLETTR